MNKKLMGLLAAAEMEFGLVSKTLKAKQAVEDTFDRAALAIDVFNDKLDFEMEVPEGYVLLPKELDTSELNRFATRVNARPEIAQRLYKEAVQNLVEINNLD